MEVMISPKSRTIEPVGSDAWDWDEHKAYLARVCPSPEEEAVDHQDEEGGPKKTSKKRTKAHR